MSPAKRRGPTRLQKVELFLKWRRGAHLPPKPGVSIWKWLEEWESLRLKVLAYGFETEHESAQGHPLLFLEAVRNINPIWWEVKLMRLKELMLENKELDMDTPALIDSFRFSYKVHASYAYTKKNPEFATPTWQGHPEFYIYNMKNPPFETSDWKGHRGGSNKGSFGSRPCPCGLKHKVEKCWLLNEAVRPKEWVPNESKMKKAHETLEADPAYKKWVEDKIKAANTAGKRKNNN